MDIARLLTDATRLPARDAAILLTREGVPVFPCVPGGKRPLTGHGFHDATCHPAQIRAWWGRWPAANIGIPTGPASGLEVVDVDVHPAGSGYGPFRAASRAGLGSGWAALVRTPSSGLHAYYPADPDRPQRSWQAAGAHVDFRGAGGYVIAPPSVVVRPDDTRGRYALIAGPDSAPAPVDAVRLRNFLDPPAPRTEPRRALDLERPHDAEHLATWVASRGEGERNRGLFWAACRLAEAGTSPADTVDALGPAAEQAGLGRGEIAATIRSAYRTTHALPAAPASGQGEPPRRVLRASAGRVIS